MNFPQAAILGLKFHEATSFRMALSENNPVTRFFSTGISFLGFSLVWPNQYAF